MEPLISISRSFDGFVSPLDLLASEGTLQFTFSIPPPGANETLFRVASDGFLFMFGYEERAFFLQRNRTRIALSIEGFVGLGDLVVFAIWAHSEIKLFAKTVDGSTFRTDTGPTEPTNPPPNLIRWARRNGMVPVSQFQSAHHFRQRVHDALQSISRKVGEADAYKSFWNIVYDGQRIKDRFPKTEPEAQPLLNCLIADQMLMAGIEVIPEAHTGAGNVDFLLVGSVSGALEKICLEVKLAHAADLEHGLFVQLPEYMRHHGAAYGIYCVLNFKGEWFDKPTLPDDRDPMFYLSLKAKEQKVPELERIRWFEIALAKPPTASKK